MASLLFVLDDRISRERVSILLRTVTALKSIFKIQLIKDSITEAEVLKRMETERYDVVLLPWHLYLTWNKVDAFYGLTRTNGPTVAGYFSEPTKPISLGSQSDSHRGIFIDFSSENPADAVTWMKSLSKDTLRSGIQPLLDSNAPIYRDYWTRANEAGAKCDTAMAVLAQFGTKRSTAIQICFHALWDLAFDAKTAPTPKGRADFQFGFDANTIALRVTFPSSKKIAKDVLASFWPNPSAPMESAQLLLKYADSFRAHLFPEVGQIEITILFTQSAVSKIAHDCIHTFWVEPVSCSVVSEIPFEDSPRLKPLTPVGNSVSNPQRSTIDPKDKFVTQAVEKIRELKKILLTKDDMIQELRSGGVGTSSPLSPPDTEALLEAFQQRYFDTRFQIHQFENEMSQLEASLAPSNEVEALRLKVAKLTAQETIWINKLTGTLETYRKAKKKA